MKNFAAAVLLALAASASTSAARADPTPAATAYALPKIVLTQQMVAPLARHSLTVTGADGKAVTYAGVDVGDLLAANGVANGKALRGKALSLYVLVIASDGYRVVFALPELDLAFGKTPVLLADRADGAPLGADMGPFRLVVPDESPRARWVHNVVEIDVLSAP